MAEHPVIRQLQTYPLVARDQPWRRQGRRRWVAEDQHAAPFWSLEDVHGKNADEGREPGRLMIRDTSRDAKLRRCSPSAGLKDSGGFNAGAKLYQRWAASLLIGKATNKATLFFPAMRPYGGQAILSTGGYPSLPNRHSATGSAAKCCSSAGRDLRNETANLRSV
jgi:hypothetical protein